MEECVDGEYQNFKAKGGEYVREHFFGKYPELLELVKDMTDEQLAELRRGGHDPLKVYNAYPARREHDGAPTVILAKTVKGYGLGEGGEGRNATHQQKKLNEPQIQYFFKRFDMNIPEEKVEKLEFYRPPEDSAGDASISASAPKPWAARCPARWSTRSSFRRRLWRPVHESLAGSGGRAASTTSAFVGVLEGAAERSSS